MYQPYMVAMSHLSDAQELIAMGHLELANKEINFAKWLLSSYREDMTSEFDPHKAWDYYRFDADF